jgi:hypothetical protein
VTAHASCRRRPSRLPLVAALLLLPCAALAQNALDAGLSATDGRINPQRVEPTMAAPIYTVNQRGEMIYNRANAFNDPSYRIYQRYRVSRFDYFTPTSGPQKPRNISSGRSASYHRMRARTSGPGSGRAAGVSRYGGRARGMSAPSYRAGGGGGASRQPQRSRLSATRYSPGRIR